VWIMQYVCRLANYSLQLILLLYVATSGDIFKAHLKTVGFTSIQRRKLQ
jgi:hypothetical protein